jgi:glycosyltransferase involved in cell wall biosynthesis
MTRISIVTPSFNQAAFLSETLESVRSQHYPHLEHIVLDGASTDASIALLESKHGPAWQHLHWQSEPDRGQSHALNKGFAAATGDIVGWLNSDDRYRPGSLEAVARAFEQNPLIDVLYGDYTIMSATGDHISTRREIEFSRLILLHYRFTYIASTATFFRRRIFDEGNFLDESLHYAMDHDFFARLSHRGYRFKHLAAVLADFRLHPSSKGCSLPALFVVESRATTRKYSSLTHRIPTDILRDACFATLRILASLLRYSEKFLRGYYLPSTGKP